MATLVKTIATPGGFEQFSVFPDTFKQEMLTLMQSIAEEQIPNIAALEQHTAQSYYENGVRAAIEHHQQEDAPRHKSNGGSPVPDFGQR